MLFASSQEASDQSQTTSLIEKDPTIYLKLFQLMGEERQKKKFNELLGYFQRT